MNSIEFSEFEVSRDAVFSFRATETLTDHLPVEHLVEFKLPEFFVPANELMALSASTLCGRKYQKIHINLDIDFVCMKSIVELTQAIVTSKSVRNSSRLVGPNIGLNFSGGFDSLACRALLPPDTKLISLDFGGRFAREKEFFKDFNTNIITTNLLNTGLHKNSWSFMGIGSILLRDHLGLGTYTFGGILEASPANMMPNYNYSNPGFPPFTGSGMSPAPVAIGLTEVGTVKVLARYCPDLVGGSLKSVANPNEAKLYRKFLLARAAEDLEGARFDLPEVDRPIQPWFSFGQSFADDFLSFYIIKNLGYNTLENAISNIPEEVIFLSKKLSLKFYERFNPAFYLSFPISIKEKTYSRLISAGIDPYTEQDWHELNEIRKVLVKFYPQMALR